MDTNNILTFFYPIIDSLNKGSLIRKVMSFLFGLIGVLSFLGGAYIFFSAISEAPDFWFVLLILMMFVASFIVLQIWFYRAKKVLNLEDSDFTVIPIISHFLRAIGESYAVFTIAYVIGGIINIWFSNYGYGIYQFEQYLPFVRSASSFIGQTWLLLITIITALFVLLLTYFIAESILVLVAIENNTRSFSNNKNESQQEMNK
ncbi:MAG: hypothetical protein M1495_17940 [Bacteroidetes bacterium]|nr:hypothetical protein [Bacteroidota bacterium]